MVDTTTPQSPSDAVAPRDRAIAVLMAIYLVLVVAFCVGYGISIWPHPPLSKEQLLAMATPAQVEQWKNLTEAEIQARFNPCRVFGGPCFSDDQVLLVLALTFGAMGGAVRGLTSAYWHLGQQSFRARWWLFYLSAPVTSALLGLGFYLILRGGLMGATVNTANVYGVVGMAFLIGFASRAAMAKLREVANTLFTTPPVGQDSAAQVVGFELVADPARVEVSQGQDATFQVTVKRVGGFAGTVALRADPLLGTTVNVVSDPKAPDVFNIVLPTQGLPVGTASVTLRADSGGTLRTLSVDIVVS